MAQNPIRPTDDTARSTARDLIRSAHHAALAVMLEDGAPMVTRIAVAPGPDGLPLGLVSDLSLHTKALAANPACSLLVGEPGSRGDPLTHPRLTLQARAQFVRHGSAQHGVLAPLFAAHQPKVRLYIGFADFSILRFAVTAAYLNAGFGKAYQMQPEDLLRPTDPAPEVFAPR